PARSARSSAGRAKSSAGRGKSSARRASAKSAAKRSVARKPARKSSAKTAVKTSRRGSTQNRAATTRRKSPGLQELLVLELQESHSAESQRALLIPRLVRAVESDELRIAIEERLEEGEQGIADVERGRAALGASAGRKKNLAAEVLVNDLRGHTQE